MLTFDQQLEAIACPARDTLVPGGDVEHIAYGEPASMEELCEFGFQQKIAYCRHCLEPVVWTSHFLAWTTYTIKEWP